MEVTRKSMLSGVVRTLELPVTAEQVEKWNSGRYLVQEVFPELSADEREFIMTGITAEEWDAAFPDEE